MKRVMEVLGNTGAVLTLVAAVLTPFLLYELFAKGVAATGVRIDPMYSGGDTSHVIERGTYRIIVNRPVPRRAPLQRVDSFVQLTWTPAARLPDVVNDEVDLDRDGKPDLAARFEVPKELGKELRVDVAALSGLVKPMANVSTDSFSALIVRVRDGIVVRIPLQR